MRTPREQMLKVCRCIADGRNSIVFFNDDTAAKMFVRAAGPPPTRPMGCSSAATSPASRAREVIASMAAWINLVKPLEMALNSGCAFDGFRLGPDGAVATDPTQHLKREYLRQLDAVAKLACEQERVYATRWYELNPSPLMSGAFPRRRGERERTPIAGR